MGTLDETPMANETTAETTAEKADEKTYYINIRLSIPLLIKKKSKSSIKVVKLSYFIMMLKLR